MSRKKDTSFLLRAFEARGSLERLSERVLAGKVVFFVGAGLSLESEGNSSWVLIGRLLARFAALTQILMESGNPRCSKRAGELRDGLKSTFKIYWPRSTRRGLLSPPSIRAIGRGISKLTSDYYSINDWMCSAFLELLVLIDMLEKKTVNLTEEILQLEIGLLKELKIKGKPQKIDNRLFRGELKDQGGKALFLDAMGFNDPAVMAGDPFGIGLDLLERSYNGRIRKGHFVLARLAREGLCPSILTTNYDLLLDGACRLSGFSCEADREAKIECPVPVVYRDLARIAQASDFFATGDGHQAALLLKIHGCVEEYRKARNSKDKSIERWQAYLAAMVFTYREIQNWRRDSWSRDLVQTLLRTRTIVFCGYSAADPVLHDTFRSVYEEMAEQRQRSQLPLAKGRETIVSGDAPAFFFGIAERREFHGLEILRAASQASGCSNSDVTDHPNYIQFEPSDRFPTSDEQLVWLYHLVFRRLQRRALEADLRRIAKLLVGKTVPPQDIKTVVEHFDALHQSERETVAALKGDSRSRFVLGRICSWTYHFQASLLRELALGEAFLRRQGPGFDFCRLRQTPWYYPATARPDWTAWAALAEIALRRAIAAERGVLGDWAKDDPQVNVAPVFFPAVCFRRAAVSQLPDMIGILVPGFTRLKQAQLRGLALRKKIYWHLDPDAMPWPIHSKEPIPPAGTLWSWATKTPILATEALKSAFGGEAL